jgi:hypothetical protein
MSAKSLVLRPVSSKVANECVKRLHYSGKVVQNSQMHIGVFWHGELEGAMSFGPPLDKRKTAGLVRGSKWQNFCELNRMAFSDALPRNSESRALGVAFRLLRKHKPALKWVVSFADATQCGDGTIYRASGFLLTAVKRNAQVYVSPAGETASMTTLTKGKHILATGRASMADRISAGWRPLPGYQFRYVRFLDPAWRERLTVPVIPFTDIPDECRMYKGIRGGSQEPRGVQPRGGGASPTPPLHPADPGPGALR